MPRAYGSDHPSQPSGSEVYPTEAISHEFKSWSLFLICGPGWILRNKDEGVRLLYEDFKAFGDAIGPNNVAVWFWKKTGAPTADNVDVDRSARYCQKYHLLPSDTPQLLVTTHFPDDPGEGDKFVVSLRGLSASEGANALDKITDQLMQSGLSQKSLDRNAFWSSLWSASGVALSAAGCYLNKVSISMHTGIFNAEISHSEEQSCRHLLHHEGGLGSVCKGTFCRRPCGGFNLFCALTLAAMPHSLIAFLDATRKLQRIKRD
jgi:hypothetical protein